MKNAIAYYYNLHSYDIHQYKDTYKFSVGNLYYVLLPCDSSNIENIYELTKELISRGIYTHQIIPNIENNLYTTINNINYTLLFLRENNDNIVTLDNITAFNNITSNIIFEEQNHHEWSILWQNKIDYFEYQVSQFGKKYPKIRESFSYYVGLAETGISLYNNMKLNMNYYYIQHKRIKLDSTFFDLYNPLNFIVDCKIRDVAEYFKDLFLTKDDIFDDIINYFQHENLSTYDCLVFYIRMFYPSFYFDMYEKIISNEVSEDKLINIIKKTDSYENLLRKLYRYMSNYIRMPDIEWLNKL